MMFGIDGILKKLAKDKPPGLLDWRWRTAFDMIANIMAVAPQRSSDGYTRLWINTTNRGMDQ